MRLSLLALLCAVGSAAHGTAGSAHRATDTCRGARARPAGGRRIFLWHRAAEHAGGDTSRQNEQGSKSGHHVLLEIMMQEGSLSLDAPPVSTAACVVLEQVERVQ